MFFNILSLLAVGLLWGCTNPFIKLGSQGIEKINTGSSAKNLWLEMKTIVWRLKYWIPFLLNQSGSVLYVWTLQTCNITVAVPVANSLTFAFTAITGYMLGEKIPGKNIIVGTLLVCIGSSFMLYDQVIRETPNSLEVQ
ncbi:transmembrane protein 234 homolog [Lucilia sericata]|uniref:transmembrane protein 234 homolog n=1 Tax=Lucilia sericata TaxID=13632 RepID=UPI0018A846E6|nr:transmembrane protein 234 homolog [Lucilia sericata]